MPETGMLLHDMKIVNLQLKNIKCFKEVELSFQSEEGPKNWSLIVGDNGQGKTTILQSLAAGLCNEEGASALLAELHGGILRHEEKEGYIKISLQDPNNPADGHDIETKIELKGRDEKITQKTSNGRKDYELEPFAVAYGSGRGITGTESYDEYALVDSLYSLFNYRYPLQNVELGARRIQGHAPKEWEELQDILKDILMLSPEDKITLEPSGLYVKSKWGKVSFNALSDGYRSLTTVILDFLSQNMLKTEKFALNDLSGIFIIDEIEMHLHPRWQRNIIKSLANKFPNVQFICSTHTPICALGLNDLVCESQLAKVAYSNGHSDLKPFDPKECFRGYRADQILTSELFGLSDTRSLTTEKKLEKYRDIYLKDENDRDDQEREDFREIENELKELPMWENEMDKKRQERTDQTAEKEEQKRSKMIKINRKAPPLDTILDRKRETELEKVRSTFCKGCLTHKSFNSNLWRNKKVKSFIYDSQHKKCCYCERKRDCGETEVEHFRPKLKVSECQEHSGYWWLAYDWKNLLISCKTCNNKKGAQFPLLDEKKRACVENDPIDNESPFLINPLKEDPEEFIEYDTDNPIMVKAIGKCERGKKTVDDLTDINNIETMKERREKLNDLKCAIELTKIKKDRKYLERHVSQKSSFAGFTKFYLRKKGPENI